MYLCKAALQQVLSKVDDGRQAPLLGSAWSNRFYRSPAAARVFPERKVMQTEIHSKPYFV
jgi:hypothetical protein